MKVIGGLRTVAVLICVYAAAYCASSAAAGIDHSFGDRGVAIVDPTDDPFLGVMTVQADRRIVATVNPVPGKCQVVRLKPNGAFDDSFSRDGVYRPRKCPDQALAVDENRRILGATGSRIVALRPNGTLDRSFGNSGFAAGPSRSFITGIVTLPDGRIFAAGGFNPAYNETFFFQTLFVAAFNHDGTPDRSFGSEGLATVEFDPGPTGELEGAAPTNLLYSASGQFLLTGTYSYGRPSLLGDKPGRDLLVVAFGDSGQLDTGFGGDGVVLHSLGEGRDADYLTDAILQGDRLLLAGVTSPTATSGGAFARYLLPSGTLDPSLSSDGTLLTGAAFLPAGIVDGAEGRFVAGGYGKTHWAVQRYLPDGERDPAFANSGSLFGEKRTWGLMDLARQSAHAVIAFGQSNAGVVVVRFRD